MFDFSKIKKDFPVFQKKINGKDIIYLDSTASSFKPACVIESVSDYYTNFGVNIFRGVYTLSQEATEKYEKARKTVADFIGSKNQKEIVFVRNTTEAINLVAFAWGRKNLTKNDEIVTTCMEHHSNILPWQQLAKEKQAKLKFLGFDKDGYLDIGELPKIITSKTKLLVFTYVSNVLGTINPVSEIVKIARRINPDIKILVDGAQAVPHMPIDVNSLDIDFLAFSGHKMLGPTGIGVLWARYDILDDMETFLTGGEMVLEVYEKKSVFQAPPHKFEAGTPHIAGALGLAQAVKYLDNIGMNNIRNHEKELVSYGLSVLSVDKDLEIYGPKKIEDKGGIIAFNVKGVHPHDVAQILDRGNVCVRSGFHCAQPLHEKLGITASVRASFYVYNDKKDIDKLAEGINKVKKLFLNG